MKMSPISHDRSARIVRDMSYSESGTTAGSGVARDRAMIQQAMNDVAERRSGGTFRFAGDELVSLVAARHVESI